LDELKYAIGLFGVFPLAYLHRRMKNVVLKHYFSLVIGVTLAFFMFGEHFH
jgi:hypothetical protein